MPSFFALNEFFSSVASNEYKSMRLVGGKYDQYDIRPIIVTNLGYLADYSADLSKRWVLGWKPWAQLARKDSDQVASIMQDSRRAVLFLELETWLSNYWQSGLIPWDDLIYCIKTIKAVFAGEIWYYPFIHSRSDSASTPSVDERWQREANCGTLCKIVADYDPTARFVDLELVRPGEFGLAPGTGEPVFGSDGRLHSSWYKQCEQVRAWIPRRPISICYPGETWPGYWPAERLREPFDWSDKHDRDLIFDPGASAWAKYPDIVGEWVN